MVYYVIIFRKGIHIIMDVFLDSKIVTNNELSSNVIAAYTALRMIQNLSTNKYYVNIKLLAFQLTDDIILSRKYMDRLSDGLNELITKKYIMVVANNADKDYILDIGNLIIDNHSDCNNKAFFVVITSEEIHKVINLDSRLDKFSALRYFMCMISTINYNACRNITVWLNMVRNIQKKKQSVYTDMCIIETNRMKRNMNKR